MNLDVIRGENTLCTTVVVSVFPVKIYTVEKTNRWISIE